MQGILSPSDARIAVDSGVDGIVVSNHGGRQLDCTPASLDVIQLVRWGVLQCMCCWMWLGGSVSLVRSCMYTNNSTAVILQLLRCLLTQSCMPAFWGAD